MNAAPICLLLAALAACSNDIEPEVTIADPSSTDVDTTGRDAADLAPGGPVDPYPYADTMDGAMTPDLPPVAPANGGPDGGAGGAGGAPVPEPGSMLLLASGLAGIGALRLARSRRQQPSAA